MENWFILVLIAGSVIGTGLTYLALKKSGVRQEEMKTFAQTQGWTYDYSPATRQTAGISSFSDPSDDWTLQLISSGDGGDRRIEWHSTLLALDGEAVLGMPLPEKSVAMMQMGGEMGKKILKAALKGTFYALGKTRFNLEIDEATAGHPGGVVMASDGQARAMDALRENTDLAQFRAAHKAAEVPVIIRDADGLKLRCPGVVKNLEELTALVALGKSLRADL